VTGRPYRGAAEAWAVSPPALSMQILELENELGDKLTCPSSGQPS
jgi:DNA-binding transcriptional LysR family regulator